MQFPKKLRETLMKHLRRVGYLNITYKAAMASAHMERGQWQCVSCKKLGTRKDLHGDHCNPVIDPIVGFVDWNTYMERLFLGQIQPLCKPCHKNKTLEENSVRHGENYGNWENLE